MKSQIRQTETDFQIPLHKACMDGWWMTDDLSFAPAHNNTAAFASLFEDKGQAFVWALDAVLCVGKQSGKISRKAKDS